MKVMPEMSNTQPPLLAREVQGGVPLPPSSEKIRSKFDLSIALTLASWSALSLAVQNSWGGPESAEKRDWFAGAISDLLTSNPNADVEYLEEFLLQVMNDEFEVNIEDGSGEEVAAKIIGFRKLTLQGDFEKIDIMYRNWLDRRNKTSGQQSTIHIAKGDDQEDTDWDSDEEDEDDSEDMDIDEAPPLVKAPRVKTQPKVDEDGFTEVINRKR